VQEQTESKTGNIIKNMAYILKDQGKNDEALKAIEEARKTYPNDLNLILTQGDIYFKLGETEKFGEIMKQAIKEDPTNHLLFFNLGVISADQKKNEEAKEYYKKAIELKPDYGDAYMNLAVVILDEEKAIVEQMNKNLSDFDAYDALILKQKDVYKRALPYLEKADEFGRSMNTVQKLMNIYGTLSMTEKAKEFTDLYRKLKEQ